MLQIDGKYFECDIYFSSQKNDKWSDYIIEFDSRMEMHFSMWLLSEDNEK